MVELYGIARIAQEAGVPLRRAAYLAESRGIEPIGEVGGSFVYGPQTAQRMIATLRLTAEARSQAGPRRRAPIRPSGISPGLI